ncbi:metallophosphoesterase family protein [Citrifermentans bremense]|uniref:metallophosphoesterase family protein n=1 Tax=Citrifermentans bremense TaxID=60035 RepID=UPI000417B55D|nr:metallophosphoesterase [Citrifermentans bremense]
MSAILHISDTHFGTEIPAVVEALLQLAGDLRPDLLVLSGDVTQRARAWQFKAAVDFLGRMPVPHLLVIPGNHDLPLFNILGRVFSPYGNFQRSFGRNLEPVFESQELLVVGVNTTRPSRHKHGEVSPRQIETVSRRLQTGSPRQLRVVAAHQPVRATRQSDVKNLLRNHPYAIHAWAEAGADLILGGHVHLPHVRLLNEVHEIPRRVWSVLAGTAVSRRVRGEIPNSVNLIRYRIENEPRSCLVERWDYAARRVFCLAEREILLLQ